MPSTRAAPARIHVVPINVATAEAVRALRVAPEQYAYVGDVAFNLIDAERDRLGEAMAILADDVVIGFYRLDFAPHAVVGRDLGEPAAGLRAMMIDRSVQGRGYGGLAIRACCDDLRRRHPGCRLLVLAVHCCNAPALAGYLRAGFVDNGERLFGGPAGPQQVLVYRLHCDITDDQDPS